MAVGPPNTTGPDRPARVLPGGARRRAAGRSATGWRPSPYLVCATLAVVGAVALSLRQPWGADFGLHVAAVGRLRDDLLDPANPMVDSPEGGPYSTPYTVALALVARLTGIPVAVVLSAAGPVNLALLLYGLRRVVALFGSDRWTPVVALAFVPLLWGTDAPRWSGFPNLRGLPLILPYPGTLGLALLLLGWAALARALAAGTPGRWVPVGLLGGVLVLVHPFTALGAALGAFALSVPRLRRPAGPDLRGAALGVAVALVVVLTWPYFRVTDLLAAARDFDAIHRVLYVDPPARYGFAFAVGLPALAVRLRRDRLDPLALLVGLAGVPVLVGGLTGAYALGRLWPVVLLGLQLAAAVELVRVLRTVRHGGVRGAARIVPTGLWVAGAAVAVLAGLVAQGGNLLLVLPRDHLTPARRAAYGISNLPDLSWLARQIRPGAVLLTADPAVGREVLRYEIRAVAPPWPDPLLSDEARRRADEAALLDPDTDPGRRADLLARYGVDWVLEPRSGYPWLDRYATRVVTGPGGARLVRLSTADVGS
jgi:alpha-1,6-mannosyltransferase